jgi:hypothetical protein
MASTMNAANILKTWLQMKNCIDFVHSRNISCFYIDFNKYVAREARVMRKLLGSKTAGKYVFTFIYFLAVVNCKKYLIYST